jgi:tetraacyldisaccharide 4'-kinase
MIKKLLNRWAQFVWYDDVFIATWLTPFTMLFIDVARFRRFLYRKNWLKTTKLACPVIIVGNISVGGTGKTPLVIALAEFLKQQGFKPGIISRGYGGKQTEATLVTADSNPALVGDEAILLAKRSGCPVAVAEKRAAAGELLLKQFNCNVILSDDGLQHYALARDIEIAVIDGERRFGNNNCLPGGPLREPLERLNEVNFVVVNGTAQQEREIPMSLTAQTAVNLLSGEEKPLVAFKGESCHAVAAIGHPQRFFNLLAGYGIKTENHSFPDHYHFKAKDLQFKLQQPLLMTEKDAVKCTAFATVDFWYIPVCAEVLDAFFQNLLELLNKQHG